MRGLRDVTTINDDDDDDDDNDDDEEEEEEVREEDREAYELVFLCDWSVWEAYCGENRRWYWFIKFNTRTKSEFTIEEWSWSTLAYLPKY